MICWSVYFSVRDEEFAALVASNEGTRAASLGEMLVWRCGDVVVWGAAKAARTICGSRCGLIVSLSSGGGGVPALPETNIFIVWWRVEADEGGWAEPPTISASIRTDLCSALCCCSFKKQQMLIYAGLADPGGGFWVNVHSRQEILGAEMRKPQFTCILSQRNQLTVFSL